VTPQGVELRHLRYFVAVADAGTFTLAAERMFIAQPTLSQQIRRLEEMAGTPLLQRRREGVRLTTAGTVLLEEPRAVLRQVDHGMAARLHTISLGELAGLDVAHGPRRASAGIYDTWLTVLRSTDPRFEFTDPPFRQSLPMTLAFAATASKPTAVLTGPRHLTGAPDAARHDGSADTYDTVPVRLDRSPLAAKAGLVWSSDLPRPLQQVLFDAADGITL